MAPARLLDHAAPSHLPGLRDSGPSGDRSSIAPAATHAGLGAGRAAIAASDSRVRSALAQSRPRGALADADRDRVREHSARTRSDDPLDRTAPDRPRGRADLA